VTFGGRSECLINFAMMLRLDCVARSSCPICFEVVTPLGHEVLRDASPVKPSGFYFVPKYSNEV